MKTSTSKKSKASELSNQTKWDNNQTECDGKKESKPGTSKGCMAKEHQMTLRKRQPKKCLTNLSAQVCHNSLGDALGRRKGYSKKQKRENVSEKDAGGNYDTPKILKMSINEIYCPQVNMAEKSFSVGDVASMLMECDLLSQRKVMQPLNTLKGTVHLKRKVKSSTETDGQTSNVFKPSLLHQLPSKLGLHVEASKNLTRNAFSLSSGSSSIPMARQHKTEDLPHLLNQNAFGMRSGFNGKKILLRSLSNRIADFRLIRTSSPFNRRCTAMAWHPFDPNLVVVGSKGGDIILLDLENGNRDVFIQGCGLGGVIQAMKFLPEATSSLHLLTASMDGTVLIRDLATQAVVTTFVDTSHLIHQFWYCSCDVDSHSKMVVHGDSLGNTVLQTLEGERIWSHKLHRNKVNHVEFHPKCEWLLASASTDQYVCLWDIRMLKNHGSYIAQLKHEKGVNSAHFNSTDGNCLLTTDQHHELRVYECGGWNLEQTIMHPHRFYQHLTPMKASWHPLEDLIICGRYPDKTLPNYANNDERGVDFIDPFSGEIICHLYDLFADGVVSLAQFNNIGSTFVATMGYTILVWQKDVASENESRSQQTERLFTSEHSADTTTPSSSLHPLPRPKKSLSKSSKMKLKN